LRKIAYAAARGSAEIPPASRTVTNGLQQQQIKLGPKKKQALKFVHCSSVNYDDCDALLLLVVHGRLIVVMPNTVMLTSRPITL
jgi:hypothetical protein